MSIRLSESLCIILSVWLFMTTTSIAQFVLDTRGEIVESDEEYFIMPAITGNGGRTTLINRNGSCPFHVGLESADSLRGLVVKFFPFATREDDDDVRVNRDLKVAFEATTGCVQSTEWRVGQTDSRSNRRFIITGQDVGRESFGNYFRLVETQNPRVYNIQWCPTEVCPTCKFQCGTTGVLRDNNKVLLALDGGALPVVFQKE